MFAMSRASNGGSTEGTQALLRHTVLDQTQPVLAYITGVIFRVFRRAEVSAELACVAGGISGSAVVYPVYKNPASCAG